MGGSLDFNLYSFICMYTKSPENLEPLLIFGFRVEKVNFTGVMGSVGSILTYHVVACVATSHRE